MRRTWVRTRATSSLRSTGRTRKSCTPMSRPRSTRALSSASAIMTHGGVAGAVERAQLAAQPQAVEADEVEAHDDELEGALGGLDERLVRVALDLDAVVLPERGGKPLMGARPVVDEEQLGVEAGLRDRRRQAGRRCRNRARPWPGCAARRSPPSGARGCARARTAPYRRSAWSGNRRRRRRGPCIRSPGWSSAVTMTTGICAVSGRVLEPPADLEAVHAGHHDVEQDDVAQALLAERQRVGPVHRGEHVEILGRELAPRAA